MMDLYLESGLYSNESNGNMYHRGVASLRNAFGNILAGIRKMFKSVVCSMFFVGGNLFGVFLKGAEVFWFAELFMLVGAGSVFYSVFRMSYRFACYLFGFDMTESDHSDSLHPEAIHHVVEIDSPPPYDSLHDLHPELFKVTLPTYDEVCDCLNAPPRYSCAMIAPVHRPVQDRGLVDEYM